MQRRNPPMKRISEGRDDPKPMMERRTPRLVSLLRLRPTRWPTVVLLIRPEPPLGGELGGRLCKALRPYGLQFIVAQALQAHKGVVSLAYSDQLVELHLDRRAIPVLRILDEKNHQEGHDRRAGIDDQLPSVGVPKIRTT